MDTIYNYTQKELKELITPSFRAKQIYKAIYNEYIDDFNNIQTLPKALREELNKKYSLKPLEILDVQTSKDKSKKYLFKLYDGNTIEAVLLLMKEKSYHEDGGVKHLEKYTICLSSQVGCKVGCAFCLTAKSGFIRNLTAGEIVSQVVMVKKDNNIEANRRLNLVFMGMGEPLDNLKAVEKSIRIFKDEDGLSISPHRQTISTSGLSHKIKSLGETNLGVNLAISLHAVDNDLREKLMPINKAYKIESIIEAIKEFPINERKRVMFEYLVLKDINDDLDSAKKLIKLLNGIKAKVNLIYFNPYDGTEFKRPSKKDMLKFQEYLTNKGVHCTIRESKGLDISGACGQLRDKGEKLCHL